MALCVGICAVQSDTGVDEVASVCQLASQAAPIFMVFPRNEAQRIRRPVSSFAADNKHLMRPLALEKLHELFTCNCIVAIVSASIDNWVRPFFDQLIVGSCSDFV